MENRNFGERREIERLEADLREATSLSNKYFGDIQRLKEAISARDLDIRGFKLRVEQLESELDQSQRRIGMLSDARQQKDDDLAAITVKIGQETHLLNSTKAALQKLDSEIQYLESLNHKHLQTQNSLTKMNDQEFFRGKELTNLENDRRITHKLREDEIAALKGEIEHFKLMNGKQIEDQYEFQNEIEALKRHVALLNQQNFEVRSSPSDASVAVDRA
jgi:chromosome segregation ATPase